MGLSIPWSKMARPAKEPSYPFGTVLQFRSEVVRLSGARAMVVGPSELEGRIRVFVLEGEREGTIQHVLRRTWHPVE